MTDLLFGFQGRTNRAKWWLVGLAVFVVEMIVFAAILGGAAMSGDPEQIASAIGPIAGVVIFVMVVLATWIHIAVAVKRYHDRNKSGWWVLIVFVPVIGGGWGFFVWGVFRRPPRPQNYRPG